MTIAARFVVTLLIVIGLPALAQAACTGSSPTWTCTADYTSLNDLINNNIPGMVQDGDTINVTQPGSVTWASRLNITNKSISLIGPGRDALTITCTASDGCLNWQTKSTGGTPAGFNRLSGFTWRQSGDGCITSGNGVSASINIFGQSGKMRIDNNRFYADTCQPLHTFNNVRGVIDHNIFLYPGTCAACHLINIEHDNWNGVGGFDVVVEYTGSTNSTLNISTQVSIACVADGVENMTQNTLAYNPASAAPAAGPVTAGQRKTVTFSPVNIANCSAGEHAFLKLERIGADGGDTYTGVAQFLNAEVTYRRMLQ